MNISQVDFVRIDNNIGKFYLYCIWYFFQSVPKVCKNYMIEF